MKAKRRIPESRKQSRIDTPNRNIWFYSEKTSTSQSPETEVISFRDDRSTILREDFSKYSEENQLITRTKKECLFVVDWQLEENF